MPSASSKYVDLIGLQSFLSKIKSAYSSNNEALYSEFSVAKASDSDYAGRFRNTMIISFNGDVSGSVSLDGSSDVTATLVVLDDSHSHNLSTITDLSSAISLSKTEGTVNGIGIDVPAVLSNGTTATTQAASVDGTGDSKVATTAFVYDAINKRISGYDSMLFKGVVNSQEDIPSSEYQAGWTYKVGTPGSYLGGITCETGDMIICIRDFLSDYSNNDFSVIQANIDGAVTGPSTSVSGNIPVFNGTSGRVIGDSGVSLGNVVTNTRKVNGHSLASDVVLDGGDIRLTGYAKASSSSSIDVSDTVNLSLGKLEYKLDTCISNVDILNGNSSTVGSVDYKIDQAVRVDSIKVNGHSLVPTSKSVNVSISPVADSGVIVNTDSSGSITLDIITVSGTDIDNLFI